MGAPLSGDNQKAFVVNASDAQSAKQILDDCEKQIAAKYEDGNGPWKLGWSLFYTSCVDLDQAKIAFLGINPGGKDAGECRMFSDVECAYTDEQWINHEKGKAPFQKQVIGLFDYFGQKPQNGVCGNFIPFRSPDVRSLNMKQEALELGRNIWKRIFAYRTPPLVIGCGKDVGYELSTILAASSGEVIPTGWGNISAVRYKTESGWLVSLPHLSRFSIFGRKEGEAAINRIFSDVRNWLQIED